MSITRKLQSVSGLSTSQIKLISRHLPREQDALLAAVSDVPSSLVEKVLGITRAHDRDQAQFEECLSHVRAFATGGLYGMQRLNEVIDVVLKHFDMEREKWEILTAANVEMDFQTGALSSAR
jgi:hypothetical protein